MTADRRDVKKVWKKVQSKLIQLLLTLPKRNHYNQKKPKTNLFFSDPQVSEKQNLLLQDDIGKKS